MYTIIIVSEHRRWNVGLDIIGYHEYYGWNQIFFSKLIINLLRNTIPTKYKLITSIKKEEFVQYYDIISRQKRSSLYLVIVLTYMTLKRKLIATVWDTYSDLEMKFLQKHNYFYALSSKAGSSWDESPWAAKIFIVYKHLCTMARR